MSSGLLCTLFLLPFLGSIAASLLPVDARKRAAWLSGAVALGAHLLAWTAYREVSGGGVVRLDLDWLPVLGIAFTLRLDGFAWVFALLVTGIGFLVALYAGYYMSRSDPVPRFYSFFLAFMGAMLGVVLSGNLVQVVFFWELTSLFSFLLIGYWHRNPEAREGARMAFIITSAGGLCLFAGVLLLGSIAGSYDLEAVVAARDRIQADALYLPALLLVLAGALTKSAQFPFHFWLPHAMTAPTPVSAFLHSAAMVKLGVFLMARLWPALAGTDEWMWIVGTAGLVTLVLGAYIAIFQNDL
ncbi:MAG TPA: proton-conducting transporter membrane subunit, partial [Usitatibacter sp.]|nr:proton-conducting transporter membrane subunit [Usitatibacter sp.]